MNEREETIREFCYLIISSRLIHRGGGGGDFEK